jgi:hypothetical protein
LESDTTEDKGGATPSVRDRGEGKRIGKQVTLMNRKSTMRIGDDNQDEFFNAANDDGVMVKDVK